MTLFNTLALAMGSSWISGIKRSASVATLGLLYLNSYETVLSISKINSGNMTDMGINISTLCEEQGRSPLK
jgi:hypothetical protein